MGYPKTQSNLVIKAPICDLAFFRFFGKAKAEAHHPVLRRVANVSIPRLSGIRHGLELQGSKISVLRASELRKPVASRQSAA